jgi:type II secretory pathway pseudopilin PulG
MPLKSLLQLTALALLAIFAISITVAWRAEQRARVQLQEQLKSAQDQITAATTRQSSRNAALEQQLAQLHKRQSAVKTPNAILQALPSVLPLPKPLTIDPTTSSGRLTPPPARTADSPCTAGVSAPRAQPPVAQASACVPTNEPSVILPVEDLKPLYDSAVHCKECQLQLVASRADLKDEQAKSAALSRELTDALHAVNGGSPLRRVARAAKWFIVGAAIGAAAAKFAR